MLPQSLKHPPRLLAEMRFMNVSANGLLLLRRLRNQQVAKSKAES